jgi:hypothetical protein
MQLVFILRLLVTKVEVIGSTFLQQETLIKATVFNKISKHLILQQSFQPP